MGNSTQRTFKRRGAEERRGMQRFFLCASASPRKKIVENSKKFATKKYCFIFAALNQLLFEILN
jgi:hypothetical protein